MNLIQSTFVTPNRSYPEMTVDVDERKKRNYTKCSYFLGSWLFKGSQYTPKVSIANFGIRD